MKKLVFVVATMGALALGACSGNNQDEVSNAEMNQPATDLNALSSDAATGSGCAAAGDAANDAANSEADALGNQQNQLENESADNTLNPSDAQEQNVSGM